MINSSKNAKQHANYLHHSTGRGRRTSGRYLSLEERLRLADLRLSGMSQVGIAAELGRSPSTNRRELARNRSPAPVRRPGHTPRARTRRAPDATFPRRRRRPPEPRSATRTAPRCPSRRPVALAMFRPWSWQPGRARVRVRPHTARTANWTSRQPPSCGVGSWPRCSASRTPGKAAARCRRPHRERCSSTTWTRCPTRQPPSPRRPHWNQSTSTASPTPALTSACRPTGRERSARWAGANPTATPTTTPKSWFTEPRNAQELTVVLGLIEESLTSARRANDAGPHLS